MIRYTDGTPIALCKDFPKDSASCIQNFVEEERRISIELIKDDSSFEELEEKWLSPWTKYMKDMNVEEKDWDVKLLFSKDADSEEGEAFVDAMLSSVHGFLPYYSQGNGRKNLPEIEILDDIEKYMADLPLYLRLRMKAVCFFLSSKPEDVFDSGVNWWGTFVKTESTRLEIKDGDRFGFQLENVQKLWHRELYNPSEDSCVFSIVDGSKSYRVVLPANGTISALFADEKCTKVVNMKSNLFILDADYGTFGASLKGKLYFCQSGIQEVFDQNTSGSFWDAATDGDGGFVVRNNCGVSFLGSRSVEKKPIRLYGVPDLWLWQYPDFHAESNLRGCPEKVVSAFAGGDFIAVWDGQKAWKCTKYITEEMTRDAFLRAMMDPFVCSAYCESISVNGNSVAIQRDGRVIFDRKS